MKRQVVLLAVAAVTAFGAQAPPGSAAPPGYHIVYSGVAKGTLLDLFLTQPDGTATVNLTRTSSFDEEWPQASPDGTMLTYRGGKTKVTTDEVYVSAADGSGARRLTFNDAFDEAPVWAPDGRSILFSSNINDANHSCGVTGPPVEPCNWDLYRVNADGTGLTQLTSSPDAEWFGSYSPDGRTIAFTVTRQTGESAVWAMPAAGGPAVQLTADALVAGQPEYSPDGKSIAFVDNFCSCPQVSHVWVMNANGSHPQQITFGGGYNDGTPAWSPDGSRIAIERTDVATGDRDVWVMQSDGTGLHDITNAPGNQIEPDWVP